MFKKRLIAIIGTIFIGATEILGEVKQNLQMQLVS